MPTGTAFEIEYEVTETNRFNNNNNQHAFNNNKNHNKQTNNIKTNRFSIRNLTIQHVPRRGITTVVL
jgi:hypothetical protein